MAAAVRPILAAAAAVSKFLGTNKTNTTKLLFVRAVQSVYNKE